MRILHTSDWHLGRTLHGVDLLPYQARFHDMLVRTATERHADVVVISGDVYDRAVPPIEAVRLLDSVLARLADVATVILTPGNHDSATRLGFGAGLMRQGVHILSEATGIQHPVHVPDEDGDVLFFGLPYLEPDVVRHQLAQDPEAPLDRSHAAVIGAALDQVRDVASRYPDARTVVLAHAFVTGGEPSESERDIRVGGVDTVPAGLFHGLDYAALGHLHGCQRVTVPPDADGHATEMWYSGSPLAYSFSEIHQKKSVLEVDLPRTAGGAVVVTPIATPVPRRLVQLRGAIEQILEKAPEHAEDWVRAVVTDPVRPEHLSERLHAALPHVLLIEHEPDDADRGGRVAPVVSSAQDPLEVASDFVDTVLGRPADDAETLVLRTALDAARRDERSA